VGISKRCASAQPSLGSPPSASSLARCPGPAFANDTPSGVEGYSSHRSGGTTTRSSPSVAAACSIRRTVKSLIGRGSSDGAQNEQAEISGELGAGAIRPEISHRNTTWWLSSSCL
jgi:hypothetical protein